MPFIMKLTPEQIKTLSRWVDMGGGEVLLDEGGSGEWILIVGQGDSRAYIGSDGTLSEWA